MRIGQMPAVVADPEGLQEVMLHLLRHALLRMPPGGVVQVDAHPQGASWVMEIIADQEDTTGRTTASGGLDLSGASLEFCEHMVAGWGGELWNACQRTGVERHVPAARPASGPRGLTAQARLPAAEGSPRAEDVVESTDRGRMP